MNAPSSPKHPNANEEVTPTEGDIPRDLADALDLSSDDSDGPTDDILADLPPTASCNCGDNFLDPDAVLPRASPMNPFGQNVGLTSSETPRIVHTKRDQPKRLTRAQQSRIVTYIDAQLLHIQRLFIKYMSLRNDDDDDDNQDMDTADPSPLASIDAPSTQTEPDDILQYSLLKLLSQIDSVVSLLWVSLYGDSHVPVIYHSNLSAKSLPTEVQVTMIDASQLWGQTEYIIKIMGDLVDYLEKYRFESFKEIHSVVELLAKIDNFVSVIIDQPATSVFSTTEKVRMDSIVQRTKLLMVKKLDAFRSVVENSEVDELGKRSLQSGQDLVPVYEQFIGEIYEGISDRTSI
ncbi:hypothetical protein OGAPHI_002003 [Ogataea philodendri]|uniref:Uncharacterized protein n=1 Tax=Ogataea philodendri TaxID=1378263 RepID=A0A9P8PBJ5_9ASCO|nr:uncharacterized protein OGAPHI_002003 [Ogataea philodendri]KAH3668249.1 hypothetical protein OGAPHI_002003 [Ogataea philodendri]